MSGPDPALQAAHRLVAAGGLRGVVLVEGDSDRVALETLARRLGRDLAGEGIAVAVLGGATSIGRFLELFSRVPDLRLSGLCDAAEEHYFARALQRAGLAPPGRPPDRAELARLGFRVCVEDLEDELVRALGTAAVEQVIEAAEELRSFRSLQQQPAQRERSLEQQVRRFLGTRSGRKAQYAALLVDRLALADVPAPLTAVLSDSLAP